MAAGFLLQFASAPAVVAPRRHPAVVGRASTIGGTPAVTDRTAVGTLSLPSLGIGTIAWNGKTEEDKARIAGVAAAAQARGLDFFDTAERYGASPLSLIPAALAGLGLPVDKSYLAEWGRGATVATKFTPTPWRRQASDVVDAARGSCERLGVDSIDLYQLHMPDIIQPFRAFGANPLPSFLPRPPNPPPRARAAECQPSAPPPRRRRPQGRDLLGRPRRGVQERARQECRRLQLRRRAARARAGAPGAARSAARLEPDRLQPALPARGLSRDAGEGQRARRAHARLLPACDGPPHRQAGRAQLAPGRPREARLAAARGGPLPLPRGRQRRHRRRHPAERRAAAARGGVGRGGGAEQDARAGGAQLGHVQGGHPGGRRVERLAG